MYTYILQAKREQIKVWNLQEQYNWTPPIPVVKDGQYQLRT